jgi:ATP-binding cassette subfamily B protein
MEKLDRGVASALQDVGLTEQDLAGWLLCDRSLRGNFADTCLMLSHDRILIATNERDIREKVFTGYTGGKLRRRRAVTEALQLNWRLESLALTGVESVKIVNLVASGMVVIRHNGTERIVAAFTNGRMGRATQFVSLFEKMKKQEWIPDVESANGGEEASASNGACPKCGRMYRDKDRPVCSHCLKKHAIFARLLKFAVSYKALIFFIVLFMLLNSATGLAIPYLQGTVLFDQALGNTGRFAGQIGLVVLLIVLFRTLSLLFGVLYGVLNARLSANVAFDLKSTVFSSMQRLSLSFFHKKQTGQLMTRVNNDANELQYFFVDGIPFFIVNAMNIIGVTGVLLWMNWKLTLLCFVPMPLTLLLLRRAFPKLWRLSWNRHRRVSRMNALISDTVSGSRVVKAFGKERQEMQRFGKVSGAFSIAEQTFNKTGSTIFPVLNMLTQFGGLVIWAFGGWKVIHGEMTFGTIITFVTYMAMLYGPIQFMNNIVGWWSYCMSAAQRVFEIQDTIPDVIERKNPTKVERMNGDIRLSGVSFGYEPNKPIIQDVTLDAGAGQMIGIVGRSGAGKSTLVNLISRLYDVTEGEIHIDGVNVKDYSMESLRRNIGIVSQEVYVFIGTIAENIAYANPGCTMEDIIRAAKVAHAHDFIEKMPDGYDTIVGTGGYLLSGGEKQRISIARAILHNPRILILDEATASLDTETELQIQEALESLMKGRTTIAIAHRLSTLRNADYLVVMDGGKISEAGTHRQLMDKDGIYKGLVNKHDEALKMKGVG